MLLEPEMWGYVNKSKGSNRIEGTKDKAWRILWIYDFQVICLYFDVIFTS